MIEHNRLFVGKKNEAYRTNQAEEGSNVVPLQFFSGKEEHGYHCKNSESDYFLHYLKLEEREGSTVSVITHAVCRNHETIFSKGYSP
jgi:hypothetical protein